MFLNITDPAIMFSGISLLLLVYTNRYLGLISALRILNNEPKKDDEPNRAKRIKNLYSQIILIKYMQAFGVLSFLLCAFAMLVLFWKEQRLGEVFFIASIVAMFLSLILSLIEILMSGQSLKIELERAGEHNLKR